MEAARNLASVGWALLAAGAICLFVGKAGLGGGAILGGVAALAWGWISARRRPPE
jgi:hypothetical protein